MKKLLALTLTSLLMLPANAQFFNRLVQGAANAAENAVQNQVNRKVEKGIDDAFNPSEESNGNSKGRNAQNAEAQEKPAQQGWTCPACGNKGNSGKFCNECGQKKPEPQSNEWTCPSCKHSGNTGKFCDECGTKRDGSKQNERAASQWNKFDFVPGDEVIFYDQLEGEQLGEFPSKWELIDGEAEIQQVNGENVIAMLNDSRIMPLIDPMWNYLPDVYTIEFDYYEFYEEDGDDYGRLVFKIMPSSEHNLTWDLINVNFDNYITKNDHITWKDDSKVIHTVASEDAISTGEGFTNSNKIESVAFNQWHHVSVSVNKRAVKVYFDETRVANIPNYKNPNGGFFGFHYYGGRTEQPAYIKNVRFAKGAKPLYDRMMTDGKFITYGITFDVGKAVIKPESMGEINRIVKLMNDNPELKFEVQGHTDNTGNAAKNQTLSEQRAKAIVDKLVEMGIAAGRLSSVGKGQTSPLADNSTDEGRAKNRRVEFVKK